MNNKVMKKTEQRRLNTDKQNTASDVVGEFIANIP